MISGEWVPLLRIHRLNDLTEANPNLNPNHNFNHNPSPGASRVGKQRLNSWAITTEISKGYRCYRVTYILFPKHLIKYPFMYRGTKDFPLLFPLSLSPFASQSPFPLFALSPSIG